MIAKKKDKSTMTAKKKDKSAVTPPATRDSDDFRRNLANPTRFPTDEEWELMTPIEQGSFIMSMEDD
jgi:hypothetical protein